MSVQTIKSRTQYDITKGDFCVKIGSYVATTEMRDTMRNSALKCMTDGEVKY